jgi:hypothetical protein
MKTISVILILVSLIASLYYLFAGWTKPESMVVYSRANIPLWGIRIWAVLLGAGGILLLFPNTFKLATILLIINSLFTITCFVIGKDLRGGFIEFLFMQIPVFLLWVGYPSFILSQIRNLFWK